MTDYDRLRLQQKCDTLNQVGVLLTLVTMESSPQTANGAKVGFLYLHFVVLYNMGLRGEGSHNINDVLKDIGDADARLYKECTFLSSAGVTGMCDRLEVLGLIERDYAHGGDRRLRMVKLTAKGWEVWHQIAAIFLAEQEPTLVEHTPTQDDPQS